MQRWIKLSRPVVTVALFVAALMSTLVASAAEPASARLTPDEISAGWIRLFDGETFFGWKPNTNVNWQIKDGVIHADTGDAGMLVTTTEFADYELRCDYRLEKGGNSGVFLRTLFVCTDPKIHGYELNMCDTHELFPTGSFVGLTKPDKEFRGDGDWHSIRATALGNKFEVDFDGQRVLSYADTRPVARRRGFIGLQKNVGKIEFKNIFLKPLATTSLFSGKDLAGWRNVPGGKCEFTVVDGTIQAKNGPGFLETEGTWGDFLLQAQIRTNGAALNSGIFFRAMPGTQQAPSNGYEAQIHNVFKDNDRTKPADFGTGAIYRLSPARKVVSNDLEWFTMSVAATGPHVGVWVDGEQVTDWTDTRKESENPRQGLRTKAGHLSLQGHDPTTNLSFRNLRIAELPGETSADSK